MNRARHKDSIESEAGRVWAQSERVVLARRPWRLDARVRFRASSLVTFFWPRRRKLPGRRDGLPAMQRARARSAKATNAK